MTDREILEKLLEGQREITRRLDNLESRFDNLESRFDGLEGKVDGLEGKVDGLKSDLDEFKGQFEEHEAKDASRHIELMGEIDALRTSVQVVEGITAKNWTDLIRLKAVK